MQPKTIITFGAYDWCVLDVEYDRALILTEKVIEKREYNAPFPGSPCVTWETCTLREYLNGEFFNRFNDEEKARINSVTRENPGNPFYWAGQNGGNHTQDNIFLLNVKEVVRYFGDSGQMEAGHGHMAFTLLGSDTEPAGKMLCGCESCSQTSLRFSNFISDQFNNARIAGMETEENRPFPYSKHKRMAWTLSNPGYDNGYAMLVGSDGVIFYYGTSVTDEVGIRPALWLKF